MNAASPLATIPAELMAELQEACDKLARGELDIEAAKAAACEMDRMREENLKKFGIQNIAVDLIREARDSR
jgi:hypothetical protein